jgi:hypothetical protein
MNQKLSDWASIAEIFASIAVVMTLIMLIIGVRENTEVVRANSYNDLLSNVDDQAHVILESERLTRIWRLYLQREIDTLTDDERFTLLLLLRSTYRTFEKAYFAYQYGTVGPLEYSRFDDQACNHFDRIGADLWIQVSEVLNRDYRTHVQELCGQRP